MERWRDDCWWEKKFVGHKMRGILGFLNIKGQVMIQHGCEDVMGTEI